MKSDKEQIKRLLLELLPQPVTSGEKMVAGEPPEVIVKLQDAGVIIAPYRAEWHGPHKLTMVVSDAELVVWGDLPDATDQLRAFLSQKIDAARKVRKDTFKCCSLCHETKPPEWMHDENTCQACASDKLGVVY